MRNFHAAIIGCGTIAPVHAESLKKLKNVKLTACADIIPKRAAELAERTGARAYHSIAELLDNENIDVLHICAPHHEHTPMVKLAAERGIAVFCEKPPAISKTQWSEFQEASAKVKIAICFQNRYNAVYKRLLDLVKCGTYGKILGARAFVTWRREAPYYTESTWRGKLDTEGGGALINQAVHTLDLLLGLLGRPSMVGAGASNHHLRGVIEVEDTFDACLMYKNGTRGLLYASNAYVSDVPVILEVETENASLRIERDVLSIFYRDGGVITESWPPDEAYGKDYWGAGHAECIKEFYKALAEGKPAPISVETAGDTIDTLLAVYESAHSGIIVEI